MNWLDLLLLAVVGGFGLRGFFRGLFREILTIVGLVGGFLLAVKYDAPLADYAAQLWKISPLILKWGAFVAIFFLVYFTFALAGWLLHRSAKLMFLQTVNRAGGAAIGIGKGIAVSALAVFFIVSSSLLSPSARGSFDDAYLVPPLSQLADNLIKAGKARIFTDDIQPNPGRSGKGPAI